MIEKYIKKNNASTGVETAKILLLGDSGVGKTSILFQFTNNKFLELNNIPTIGVDYQVKMLDIEGTRIKLQIWDTSGQEKFRTITKSYYRGAQGILVVFDVTRRDMFSLTKYWINSIKELAATDVEIALVGNKCDLEKKVTKEEAVEFANEYNIPYFETSAKDNSNIDEVFIYLAKKIHKKNVSSPPKKVKTIDIIEDSKPESGSKNEDEKKGCSC